MCFPYHIWLILETWKSFFQKLTGIGANKLKLCTTNLGKPSGKNPLNDPNMLHNYVQITSLSTKQGPCFHLTNMFAYEATICDWSNIEANDHADNDNTATTEEENESVKRMTKSDLEHQLRHLNKKLFITFIQLLYLARCHGLFGLKLMMNSHLACVLMPLTIRNTGSLAVQSKSRKNLEVTKKIVSNDSCKG